MENSREMDRLFRSQAVFCLHNCFWQKPREKRKPDVQRDFLCQEKKKKLLVLLSHSCPSNAGQIPILYLEQLQGTPESSPASHAWGETGRPLPKWPLASPLSSQSWRSRWKCDVSCPCRRVGTGDAWWTWKLIEINKEKACASSLGRLQGTHLSLRFSRKHHLLLGPHWSSSGSPTFCPNCCRPHPEEPAFAKNKEASQMYLQLPWQTLKWPQTSKDLLAN